MNAPMNLFLFLILICLLIPLLLFFLKLKKKNYRLAIQETKLDQISQEVSKKQHENDLIRRKLEDQKIKVEQEYSRIKSEREKLTEEYRIFKSEQENLAGDSRSNSEEKKFLEQEKKKLKERIQKVKEVIEEVENEKENNELEKIKLETEKKEINNAHKQIQSDWQKIRLEKDRLEGQKDELREQESDIRKREQQIIEEIKFIESEKAKLEKEWKSFNDENKRIAKLTDEIKDKENEIKNLEFELRKTEKSNQETAYQIRKLEQDKISLTEERTNFIKEKESSLNKISELEFENNALRGQEKFINPIMELQESCETGIENSGSLELAPQMSDQEGEPIDKSNSSNFIKAKIIDMGCSHKKKKSISQTSPNETVDKKSSELSKQKEKAKRIQSPFVEINLDEAKVFLILPEQQLKIDNMILGNPQQLNYKLQLNGEKQIISVKTRENKKGILIVEGNKIELDKPLKKFQISFPDILQDRTYSYTHNDENFYAFISIGYNRGRMYYLYDKDGISNPLPKRNVWALLNEDFDLQTELGAGDIIDEEWLWERWRIFRIDLSGKDSMIIKNKVSNENSCFPLKTSFCISGEQMIKDDFRKEYPLFAGELIQIKAPYENPDGWIICIRHKQGGDRIVAENWTGAKTLDLKLPDNLPYDFGEFQVDIFDAEHDERPVETLCFRYIPSLQIEYPEKLIIPDNSNGHAPEIVNIFLGSDFYVWEIYTTEKIVPIENGYQVELPPETDVFFCSITKKDKPETQISIRKTIPRLKWRISNQEIWNDKPLEIRRDELAKYTNETIEISTNDFDTEYDFLSILERDGQKLQEAKFTQRGTIFILQLDQFYDTINQNKDRLTLEVEIRSMEEYRLLHQVKIFDFAPPLLKCRSCNVESFEENAIMSHIEEYHLSDFIEPLTLEEMREYDSSLPHKIYKCNWCPKYVREDDPKNPTSSIDSHISKDCHGVDRTEGSPKISFRVIDDLDEIRKHVLPNLPYYSKCKICRLNESKKHFKNQNKKEYLGHLIEKHKDLLYFYV